VAAPHQIVNHRRFRRQKRQDLGACLGFVEPGDRLIHKVALRLVQAESGGADGGNLKWQIVQNIRRCFNQDRPLTDQVIAAPGARIQG